MGYKFSLKKVFFFIFYFFSLFIFSQKRLHILTDTQTGRKFARKDSAEAVKFLDSLAKNGFFLAEIREVTEKNDKVYITFDKKQNFHRAEIEISDSLAQIVQQKTLFFTNNIDSLKSSWNDEFSQRGYAFNRVKTEFMGMKNGIPKVKISIIKGEQRRINKFVVKGYENLPERFIKNISNQYKNRIYTDKNLLSIQKDLQNHSFVALERPPQTLFTKDSTQIFLFLQKKKANSFDAMVGFANDKTDKLSFSGTLNLQFKNIFNAFENLGLYWQRTPEKSQTFNLLANFPYILGTNIGTDVQLNIYRQGEDFANVIFSPTLFYTINNYQKVGVKASVELSTTEQINNNALKNYSKQGIGLSYRYTRPTPVAIFEHSSLIALEGQFFQNHYEEDDVSARQYKLSAKAEHNLQLINNHWLNLKAEGGLLRSNYSLSSNEAFRFGGWNSLRGFNENILLAHQYYFAGAEYRYLVGTQAFFDLFGQYGQMQNNVLDLRPKVYSIGLGFHFYLPIGLMSFQISNGATSEQVMKFSDTKIHWGIISKF